MASRIIRNMVTADPELNMSWLAGADDAFFVEELVEAAEGEWLSFAVAWEKVGVNNKCCNKTD